jgi:FixJ family two-component response regulator
LADARPIAVIDDDESVRLSIAGLLRSLGHAVRVFASAEDYVAALAGADFSCVVCDIHLPGMSGLDLQQWLRTRGRERPIVFVSAYADAPMAARTVAAGAVCCLAKPFAADALIACIATALGE